MGLDRVRPDPELRCYPIVNHLSTISARKPTWPRFMTFWVELRIVLRSGVVKIPAEGRRRSYC